MNIGEVLELTQTKRIEAIAKDHLSIGEKPTREALKKAGCVFSPGKKGWSFDGDPLNLEKSIYEFAPKKKINRKPKANVSTKDHNNESNKVAKNDSSLKTMNKPSPEENFQNSKEDKKPKANVSTKKQNNTTNKKESMDGSEEFENQRLNNVSKEQTIELADSQIVRVRTSFDCDIKLKKEAKIASALYDIDLYLLIEDALRKHLNDLKKEYKG